MNFDKANLIPTKLDGHYTFAPPPEGFHPLRASDDDLARYGILHRPDPKKTPELPGFGGM